MKNDQKPLTYNESGVDIELGEAFVEDIAKYAKTTDRVGSMGGLGGFGGLFDIGKLGFKSPILVSSTDGVGTKLLLAIEANRHSTIGVDLVAMCVNDLIVQGAEPLFFLDYYATGKLERKISNSIIQGIIKGCKLANMALLGGETAEMPGMYSSGKYDLAGFSVGIVEKDRLITGERISEKDSILALPSSGLHSNGFSLVRKIINKHTEMGLKTPSYDELLCPTSIYVQPIVALLKKFEINGIVHVTGGGITHNLPRILPQGLGATLQLNQFDLPEIFQWIMEKGPIELSEMLRTFNCGIGMLLIVNPNKLADIQNELSILKQPSVEIGTIEKINKIEYSGLFKNL